MNELFAALFLLVFIMALIYVVKKLLDSGKTQDYRKFIIIPISNSMPEIAKTIKSAYWDNKFSGGSDESEILIYLRDEPDENCTVQLSDVCEEFDSVKIIKQNSLENYIRSKM